MKVSIFRRLKKFIMSSCKTCWGSGMVPCSHCRGRGKTLGLDCSFCLATGKESCSICWGTGKLKKDIF